MGAIVGMSWALSHPGGEVASNHEINVSLHGGVIYPAFAYMPEVVALEWANVNDSLIVLSLLFVQEEGIRAISLPSEIF